MKNKISVIITTKNSAKTLEALLKSIKNQTYKNFEVILVDNNSTDETKIVAKKYTELVFDKGPERSAQRNFGAKKAKGEYLLFLDSDMELSKNILSECIAKITKFGGLIIPEYSFGEGFWSKCKALERSFYLGNSDIEAARFYKKAVFDDVKGFDTSVTGPEDWDLSQRVQEKFGIGRINSKIAHNEGKLSLSYTLSKKYYYGKSFKKYMNSHKSFSSSQISVVRRFSIFFSSPKILFKHPLVGIGMIYMKSMEYLFGFAGYIVGKRD